MCNGPFGDLSHLLFECLASIQIWALSFMERKMHACSWSQVDEWVKKILQSLPPKYCEDFATLSYEIWGNRNDAFFNGKVRDPLTLVSYALNSQAAFWEANLQATTIQSPRHSSVWSLPPAPHFKVNFDAYISTVHQIVGIGVVIHSCDGQFIAGLSKKLRILSSAELAEALAAREAISLAKILMIPSFILEGDVFSVIKHISSSDEILSNLDIVLEDICITLSDQYLVDVVWTLRDANKIALSLTNFAKTSNFLESLWSSPSTSVKQLVSDDFQQSSWLIQPLISLNKKRWDYMNAIHKKELRTTHEQTSK